MLLSVQYLHANGIAHRDLKLQNFLYADKEHTMLKLIDFGFSKVWDSKHLMHQCCGSLCYVAPEVLHRKYTDQADMWSMGVMVYILLSGQPPFRGHDDQEIIENILNNNYTFKRPQFKSVSLQAQTFVGKLLVRDPAQRLTASQALLDPWIAQRNEAQVVQLDRQVLEDLKEFAVSSSLRRAVLTAMAYSLTSAEIKEFSGVFLALDTQHTGKITMAEFVGALQGNLETSTTEMKLIFDGLDVLKDGEIHYTEFVAALLSNRVRLHEGSLRELFRRFDHEGTGTISRNDLKQVLGSVASEVDELLTEVDASGKEVIDYERFLASLQAKPVTTSRALDAAVALVDSAQDSQPVEEVCRGSSRGAILKELGGREWGALTPDERKTARAAIAAEGNHKLRTLSGVPA